jgi:hypothetical protein
MVVKLFGFTEKNGVDCDVCLLLTVNQLCLHVSGQAVNYARVYRVCNERVNSEVTVKCANDTAACVWMASSLHHCGLRRCSHHANISMLDIIVVLCNGQLGVEFRQQ